MAAPAAILAAALAVLAAGVVATSVRPSDDGDPSSWSAGRSGTLALYTWLHQLGFPIHRIEGDLDLSGTDVLIVVDPLEDVSDAEAGAVEDHLRSGGDVILAAGPGSIARAGSLLDRLHIEPAGATGATDASPAQPLDPAGRVRKVPTGVSVTLRGSPDAVPLLTSGGDVVAAAVRPSPGGGRAYVIGTSRPLSNDGLRRDDAAAFVLTLLERARNGRIGVDEIHHGAGTARTGPAAVFSGPVGLAAALAAGTAFLYLVIAGRRLGRPLPAPAASRVPSVVGHVSAVAGLHARSHRRGGIAARLADDLKRRSGATAGVDRHLPDDAFAAAIGDQGGERAGDVGALLRRARELAAGRPSERELVGLSRDMHEWEQRWRQPGPEAVTMAR